MDKTVSFIGVGNMGGALLEGVRKTVDPKKITITDSNKAKARELAARLGCVFSGSNADAAGADYVFLCVKPQILGGVLEEIRPVLFGGRCLVSIAAGVTIASIRQKLKGGAKDTAIIRVMPAITAAVGQGMLALCPDDFATETQVEDARALLAPCGRVDELGEALMDQFTVVAGCLPAWVFLFIEAVADGAVLTGLPRDRALEYAAQTVLGSAAMVLEQGKHPGALKDMVCSPGGSTIAGVAALERGAFRGTVIDAVVAAYQRNKELGNG